MRVLIDPETGLSNADHFSDLLRREIARSRRYGDRSSLAVFDIRTAGFRPSHPAAEPPSPAAFVAATLQKWARNTDVVARLDDTRYLVLLTESDYQGAQKFASRMRTALSSVPYAKNGDQSGIYARAWAGCAEWTAEVDAPETYVEAACRDLEQGRLHYEAEQSWFAGEKVS